MPPLSITRYYLSKERINGNFLSLFSLYLRDLFFCVDTMLSPFFVVSVELSIEHHVQQNILICIR